VPAGGVRPPSGRALGRHLMRAVGPGKIADDVLTTRWESALGEMTLFGPV
jgi:hypothetical protein